MSLHLVLQLVALVLILLTLPGTFELALLTLASLLPERSRDSVDAPVPISSLALVIPAHDEAATISRCVESARACAVPPGVKFSIVVIADNCTDATAALAADAGARVMVRRDSANRGKGFALDFAFERLLAERVDAVMVVDADSVLTPGSLGEVVRLLRAGADAVQIRYMVLNPGASLRVRLLNVAFLAFNILRPRSRERLGLSAGILGNGFALSSSTLRAVPYEAGSIVEDLEYHLLLVRSKRRVRFAEKATVLGAMPTAGPAARSQRARWEGGRLRMAIEHLPSMANAFLHGEWRLLEPCLDLSLLPLAFHVTALLIAIALSHGTLQICAILALVLVAAHIVTGVFVGGGGLRDLAALAASPLYVLWKIAITPLILRSSTRSAPWVRTARD